MIKIYKTKVFERWLRKTNLSDQALIDAVNEMISGLIDADLGDCLFKKRIALPGAGKRSGVRTLIASKVNDQWFFLYGFAKNEQDNITEQERKALQALGQSWLQAQPFTLERAVIAGELIEVIHHGT
jgi:hypothetical protein